MSRSRHAVIAIKFEVGCNAGFASDVNRNGTFYLQQRVTGMNIKLWPFTTDPHSRFEQLMGPHMKHLFQLAFRFTGQRDDAEDLVQDLLLKLYPRLQEMQQIDKLAPWLTTVLYRLFVDQFRRQQRSVVDYGEDDSMYATHVSDVPGPSDRVNAEMIRSNIHNALQKLKQEQRILVLLHDVEGYSLEEIRQMIDIPVGTIKSRLSRARTRLREIINYMEPNEAQSVLTGN